MWVDIFKLDLFRYISYEANSKVINDFCDLLKIFLRTVFIIKELIKVNYVIMTICSKWKFVFFDNLQHC